MSETDLNALAERLERRNRGCLVEIDRWGHIYPVTPSPGIDKTKPNWLARSALKERGGGE